MGFSDEFKKRRVIVRMLMITRAPLRSSKVLTITVDYTLLFRAALPTSLGSWVLAYEVTNNVAN